MTAYAVVEFTQGNRHYKFHLKSVNHRYFELRWKAPRAWITLETRVRTFLQNHLIRGSIDFWVEEVGESSAGANQGPGFLFSRLEQSLQNLPAPRFYFPKAMRALILSRFPELWLSPSDKTELRFEDVEATLTKLISDHRFERVREGSGIKEALGQERLMLEKLAQRIATQVERLRRDAEKLSLEKITTLSTTLGVATPIHERLLQEWLVLAEKRDIAEELQRILAHLEVLATWLSTGQDNLGKRLDFLMQELHREWTTLGNKIQNAEIAQLVIEAKLAIEKVREQALNIC